MNRHLFFPLLLGLCGALPAAAQRTVEGLVKAEQSFAAHSVKHGTRAAFLQYMDSNSVLFEKGEAVNGLKTWTLRENRPGILNWHPQYVELAASKDFGFSTGPWTFQNGANDTVSGRGQFITVWTADPSGNWKFRVDIGVGGAPAVAGKEEIRFREVPQAPAGQLEDVLQAEQVFIESLNRRGFKAYSDVLSEISYLHRNGAPVAATPEARQAMILATPSTLEFEITGSGMARSGDLAYVYGSVRYGGKKEAFLHIWRKENDRWMMAVEVLRY